MQAIWTLAVKDFRMLTRNLLGMFFIIVFPVVMGLCFGVIGKSFGDEPKEDSIRLAVIDRDDSDTSRRFIETLDAIGAIQTVNADANTASDRVRRGELAGFVEIPAGFGETAGIFWAVPPTLSLGVDPARRAEAAMLQGMIMQAMGRLVQHRLADPAGLRKALRATAADVADDPDMPDSRRRMFAGLFTAADVLLGSMASSDAATTQTAMARSAGMQLAHIQRVTVAAPRGDTSSERDQLTARLRSGWDISFPSAILWGVMGCVAGFAVSIAQERQAGTFFRLQVAPITRTQILAGKALACFLAVLGEIAFMMVLGMCLGIQLARPDLLIVAGVCIAIGFAGIMMLMATISKSEQAVAGGGWAMIVVCAMFGGGMIPLLFMPDFMVPISHASPVKWGILALEGAIWRGFTLTEMIPPCAVLLAMGIAGFALGARILTRVTD